MQSIYIMHSNGKYKIGVSKNPKERVKHLGIGNCDINLIYESIKLSNAYSIESDLHKILSEFSVGREWFCVPESVKLLEIVKKYVNQYGNTEEDKFSNNTEEMKIKDGNETYFLNEWITKIENETLNMTFENEELQKFLYAIQGYYVPNTYTDLIYKVVFGKSAKQLREEYGISKKDNLRDYFSEEDLNKVQNAEMLVSSLIGYGWGYNEIKNFITEQSRKFIAA